MGYTIAASCILLARDAFTACSIAFHPRLRTRITQHIPTSSIVGNETYDEQTNLPGFDRKRHDMTTQRLLERLGLRSPFSSRNGPVHGIQRWCRLIATCRCPHLFPSPYARGEGLGYEGRLHGIAARVLADRVRRHLEFFSSFTSSAWNRGG